MGVCIGWGWPIAIFYRRGSRGGRPGRDLEFVPMCGWSVPIGGLVLVGLWIFGGKGCSSARQSSSSVMIGIMVVMESEIWLPDQISVLPMGCKSAVSSVATFLPIIDGHVAWPLWVWNASSRG